MAILAILILIALLRGVLGPRYTDRVIASNMVNTEIIVAIALMAFWSGEEYLDDVCLIYAAISFLSLVVLSRSLIIARRKRGD